MAYGGSRSDLARRAATYVGQNPQRGQACGSPCGAADEVELVINLKTAKQIGLMIPPNVLARANRVIK